MLNSLLKYTFIALLVNSPVFGQDKLDPKLLEEELVILGNIAVETSPKLTAEGRAHILNLIEENKKKIVGKPMNAVEFLDFFSNIDLSTQFDEHASINIPPEVLAPILSGKKLFPIPIKIVENDMVVNHANDALPFGSIIHTINGQTTDVIMAKLSKDFDTFSKRRIERQFSLVYCIKYPSSETYTVTYSTPDAPGINEKKQVRSIDLNSWVSKMNEESVYPLNKGELKNLVNTQYYPENNAYYFQLNSFNWYKNAEKGLMSKLSGDQKNFDRTFKKIFKEINAVGAENLIIDLRYNGGGSIYVPGLLYAYIAQQPFVQEARLEIPDFSFPYEEYITELNQKEIQDEDDLARFVKKYRKEFEKFESGYFWETIKEGEYRPKNNAFQGNVYLLISGHTCSAASYFTALFKGESRGTIVGEEIGGSHHSITAGTSMTYQLPHSRLKVKVPLMIVDFSDDLYKKVPELKIMPDVHLSKENYLAYFLKKEDPELEIVFDLIRGNQ